MKTQLYMSGLGYVMAIQIIKKVFIYKVNSLYSVLHVYVGAKDGR